MSFFILMRREMQGSLTRLLVMSALGGASNAVILAAVNSGAQTGGGGKVNLLSVALFVVALVLFVKSQHYILIAATVEIEAIIHKLRVRLMDQVRRSELVPLDTIGRAGIVAAITRETATLTQATNMIAFAAQSVILIVFVAIYVAYLSLLAFAMTIVIVGAAALFLHLKSRDHIAGTREAAEWDNRLFDRLTDLLDGFKEVRLNSARSDDLFDDIIEVSRTAANIKIRTQSETFKRLVFSQSSIYILLGAIVFVTPVLGDPQSDTTREDHHRHIVRCWRVFRLGAIDTDLERCECCGGQYRATRGKIAGDDRRRTGRPGPVANSFRKHRRTLGRVPLRR